MKKSLSIINTGIQLVNCIEAIKHFGCENNYLIIGQFNICPDRIRQIRKMLKDPFLSENFKKIYLLPFQFSNKNPLRFFGYLASAFKFALIILFSKKIDYCFYGVYTDVIMRPVTYLVQYKNNKSKICLIDDGIRVISDADNRIKQEPLIARQEQKCKFFLKDFCRSIMRKWMVPHLHFFTTYTFPLLERDTSIPNHYLHLKNNNPYHYVFKPDAVVLIGQPFIELKMVEEQTYSDALSKIYSLYKDRPVYYMPHPLETLYPKFIQKDTEIIKTPYPVELLLLGSNLSTLVGFNSSVLFNAAWMNICDEILSYQIPEDQLLHNDVKANALVYKAFSNAGIKFINACTANR